MAKCQGVNEPTGHQKKGSACTKEAVNGSIFCTSHQPKVVKEPSVTAKWMAYPIDKKETVNKEFQKLCESDTYNKRIIHLVGSKIRLTSAPFYMKSEKNACFMMQHDTQSGENKTVFYSWKGFTTMYVYALGAHDGGNKKYSVTWFDGKEKTITLNSKGQGSGGVIG